MVKDRLHSLQEPNTYNYALNTIRGNLDARFDFISNEGSTKLCASMPNIVGASYIDERNQTLFFCEGDQIYLVDHDSCDSKFVMSAGEFGCSWNLGECEYHRAEFKSIYPCQELYVYFSSKYEYYWFNLDEMCDPKRKAALKACMKEDAQQCSDKTCDYFKVFKCVCAPKVSPHASQTGGGGLQAGSYQFIVRLRNTDGSYTNWFNVSHPVYIGSDHNEAGERSNGHIDLKISCLDCAYHKAEVAVIKSIGGQRSAEIILSQTYNDRQISFTYYGQDGDPIALQELMVKDKTYIQGMELIQKDGRMFYYKLKQRLNLHYQPKANNIITEWVEYEFAIEDIKKTHHKSFMRGESYAFGIVWNYKDGTHSRVFHIPAGSGGGSVGNTSCDPLIDDFGGNRTSRSNSGSGSSGGNTDSGFQVDENGNECWVYEDSDGVTDIVFSQTGSVYTLQVVNFASVEPDVRAPIQGIIGCIQQGKVAEIRSYWDDGTFIDFEADSIIESKYPVFRFGGNGSIKTMENATKIVVKCLEEATPGGPQGGAGNSDGGGGGGGASSGGASVEMPKPRVYERKRQPKEDVVHDPQHDDYDDFIDEDLKRWETIIEDVCEACTICNMCPKGQEVCDQEHEEIDRIFNNWEDIIHSLIGWQGDDLTYDYSPEPVHVSADHITEAIKDRERIFKEREELEASKSASYSSGKESSVSTKGQGSHFAADFFDCCGKIEDEAEFRITGSGRTTPKIEENIRYPDQKDCCGEFIYRGLAGQQVRHHKFPETSEKPHYVSTSVGVPSRITPDADEYRDGYVRLMGVRFSNIEFPTYDELGLELCDRNPYTIVYVKRDDTNKTIMAKGLGTKTYIAPNQGKDYAFPRHAVNSFETVDRHIDTGGGVRMVSGAGDAGSFNFHSLDTSARKPPLNIDTFRVDLEVYGQGYRHGLYAKGQEPVDQINGTREDQRGTRQAVNLSQRTPIGSEQELQFATYAEANSVVSPPPGGSLPLMNRWRESNLWVGGSLPGLSNGGCGGDSDKSFVGDVLNHQAPITDAAGHYVTLKRTLPDQYGDLVNLQYIPLMYAGKNNGSTIEGPVGDIFIGPYSFRRTSYVSEKVGDFFDIGACVDRKHKRSLCDPPEDALNALAGTWVWTTLPEDSDKADAKNHIGLHTPGCITQGGCITCPCSKEWPAANATCAPESDIYYPRVLKTLITFWGEFEVNPYLRQKGSKELGEVWYPELPHDMDVDSAAPDNHPWETSYLNRFYCVVEQPSVWKRFVKAMIRTMLNFIAPMVGIDNLMDIQSNMDMVPNVYEFPMLAAIWYVMTQVIYTNEFIDKLLLIPDCKMDCQGGQDDNCLRNFEDNYHKYNWDYSSVNDFYPYYGMPDPYLTCKCDTFDRDKTTNEIYYSDKQIENSLIDAYKQVRPRNFHNLKANDGRLHKLFIQGSALYAHTTDDILIMKPGRTSANDLGSMLLGDGKLLDESVSLMENVDEGFAGLQNTNAAISTQFGYFWVDEDACKIYRFSGELEEISAQGMFNFFKNNLCFCNLTDCCDEKVPGTSFYSLGVDPRLNRFLITKHEPTSKASFTMSYDLEHKNWVSFHSYMPKAYIWDRRDLYSIVDGEFWRHNERCNFQTFYGTYYPHKIEFTARTQNLHSYEYRYNLINTETERCAGCEWIEDLDKTYNKLAVYNSTQGTGTLDIDWRGDYQGRYESMWEYIQENPNHVFASNEKRIWRINALKDHRNPDCGEVPMLLCEGCQAEPDINEAIFDCSAPNKQEYEGKVLADKYLIYRYTFDEDPNTQINFINHNTYGENHVV